MNKHVSFTPTGDCSRRMEFDIVDDKICNLKVTGGCHGNLQGVSALIEGMNVDEAIARLEGIRCGFKSTSCPDQLARALKSNK